jgi:hypothetical protein
MKLTLMASVLLVLPTPIPADAAPARKAAKPVAGKCVPLKRQYETDIDTVSRYMAFSNALGSSASPSLRSSVEDKQSNALSRARLDIDLLKASGCPVPTTTPSPERYEPAALGCARSMIMSRYGGERPTACDPATWQPYDPPK